MKNIKGVIFDFNGVLLWDAAQNEQSWHEFSQKYRGHPMNRKEFDEHMHGVPNQQVQEYIFGRPVPRDESLKFTEEKESLYRNSCLALGKEFKLSPGSIELFEYLKRKNIPFTIATSSEIGNVKFFFEHLYLDKWFKMDSVMYDTGTYPGKPAPDIYLKAAEKIGVSPAECLVAEDAKSGIQAAYTAGIGCIVALGTKERKPALVQLPGVDLVIERVDELITTGPLAE